MSPVSQAGATTLAPERYRLASFRVVIGAICLSLAVGIGIVGAPQQAILAVLSLVAAAVVLRAPFVVFAASLLLLAYSPEGLGTAGILGRPELQKAGIFLALVPLLLSRGLRPMMLLPAFAYIVLAVLSVVNGQLASGLGLSQMLSTYVTFTVGWFVLATKWDGERDLVVLKIVAALPVICVALGLVLQATGLHEIVQQPTSFDATTRLRGASIASQLGLSAFISSVVALVVWRISRWRPALLIFALDAAILAATASRGAAAALGVAVAWPALRYGLEAFRRSDPRTAIMRLAALGGVLALLAATLVPRLESRNTQERYYAGYGTVSDSTSGRQAAWDQFYAIAKEEPIFGHGLGSGPLTEIEQKGFLAQHNEYLRFFLEGGYVGGGIVLLSILLAVGTAIRRSPRWLRLDLAGAAVALGLVSYTDNTLSSIVLIVPFAVMVGICASLEPGAQPGMAARAETTPAAIGAESAISGT